MIIMFACMNDCMNPPIDGIGLTGGAMGAIKARCARTGDGIDRKITAPPKIRR
jgi:hypothetical protein